ncbi:hypothetical protein Ancab_000090 [Ancistrocladus abbreviatus]
MDRRCDSESSDDASMVNRGKHGFGPRNGNGKGKGGSDLSYSDRKDRMRQIVERERESDGDRQKRAHDRESSYKENEWVERRRESRGGDRKMSERKGRDELNGRFDREKRAVDSKSSDTEDKRAGRIRERRRTEQKERQDLDGRSDEDDRRSRRDKGHEEREIKRADEKMRSEHLQHKSGVENSRERRQLNGERGRREELRTCGLEESGSPNLDSGRRDKRRSEHGRKDSKGSLDGGEIGDCKEKSRREGERSGKHGDVDRRRDEEGRHRKDRHKSHYEDDDNAKQQMDRNVDHKSRKTRGELVDGDLRSRKETARDERMVEIQASKEEKDREVEEVAKSHKASSLVEANPAGDVASLGRTGGIYIPPFKLARMMREVEDKSSVEYQRLTWDALRKSINGLVNKVNSTNIKNIIPELFGENLIRGRGLFCRSCMKSQMASPGFTDVFAALVAVVNTKFPEVGDLLLRRIALQFKRAYRRNDKPQLLAAVKFIAHLVNQQVAHELLALEVLTILLDYPTDDSVEVAVGFVTECGSMLQDLSPRGLHGIFERFRGILHEGEIDKRVQFLIEGLFAIRKAKFQSYPAVRPELDLVEPEDQLTHEIDLDDDEIDPETSLDIFKPDPNFLESEKRYEELKKSILGEESEDEKGSDVGSEEEEEEEEEDEEDDEEEEQKMQIRDQTETNLVNLRRTIYLTIMSSVDFEEAGHKLLKIKLEQGQEMELCIMLLECCSQERTYLRYYGLLGQRFCMLNKVYQDNFEKCFVQQYSMIHRLETNKLRNVAKFFAHLLGTDALSWHVLAYIRLTEEDTTSSSRIFIKILFQELSEQLGIRLLNERLNDPTMQESFESIFPKDNPRNTRFAINFFTSIGLGGITENLREYLKNMPRLIMQQQKAASESEGDSGSDSDSLSGSESESESDSSNSGDSDKEVRQRKKRRRG